MAKIERRPAHMQVADHYREQIVSGQLPSGTQLPPARAIAVELGVSVGTVVHAIEHLKVSGLVRTSQAGTFVNGQKMKLSPKERLEAGYSSGVLFPFGETVEIRSADLVPVPEYVATLLGLGDDSQVIRREYVTSDSGGPCTLSVSWYPPSFAGLVPELLRLDVIDATTILIRERTGRRVIAGEDFMEGRAAKPDGREAPLLGVPEGSPVLAVVNLWMDGAGVIEYDEHVLHPGRTISYRYNVDTT